MIVSSRPLTRTVSDRNNRLNRFLPEVGDTKTIAVVKKFPSFGGVCIVVTNPFWSQLREIDNIEKYFKGNSRKRQTQSVVKVGQPSGPRTVAKRSMMAEDGEIRFD